jgi:hypothetical protein
MARIDHEKINRKKGHSRLQPEWRRPFKPLPTLPPRPAPREQVSTRAMGW